MSAPFVQLLREGLLLVLLLAAPPVLAVLAVGIGAAFLQTATQVRDPVIGLVPKLLAAALALGLAGSWMGGRVTRFARTVLDAVPTLGRS